MELPRGCTFCTVNTQQQFSSAHTTLTWYKVITSKCNQKKNEKARKKERSQLTNAHPKVIKIHDGCNCAVGEKKSREVVDGKKSLAMGERRRKNDDGKKLDSFKVSVKLCTLAPLCSSIYCETLSYMNFGAKKTCSTSNFKFWIIHDRSNRRNFNNRLLCCEKNKQFRDDSI